MRPTSSADTVVGVIMTVPLSRSGRRSRRRHRRRPRWSASGASLHLTMSPLAEWPSPPSKRPRPFEAQPRGLRHGLDRRVRREDVMNGVGDVPAVHRRLKAWLFARPQPSSIAVALLY